MEKKLVNGTLPFRDGAISFVHLSGVLRVSSPPDLHIFFRLVSNKQHTDTENRSFLQQSVPAFAYMPLTFTTTARVSTHSLTV